MDFHQIYRLGVTINLSISPPPATSTQSARVSSWARDRDNSLVPVGEIYSQSYGIRLWRLPTQFLMDDPPNWLPRVFPWLVWGALVGLVARLFFRR